MKKGLHSDNFFKRLRVGFVEMYGVRWYNLQLHVSVFSNVAIRYDLLQPLSIYYIRLERSTHLCLYLL